ncbi:NAD-dependent epimerase/dehydratase family protein [Mycolicibacterium sphagni]|uniref:UDP-glucose 4-epimerase n=1 Tax=Mycolicibacterium sphagni TaxID=1786 RepID=A0ABX2JTR6_9MYCO|nr:NAD(P)-dependent oxidoreductase [Mycolicibacterium sphagni]NTY58276.1 NAD(P)-dependent oxidoreductase [Mycolicibacterium sphagni]
MSDAVLVTGAFGLVGSATVKQLAAAGRHVVATDLETEATQKAAAELPSGVNVRWADLTDPAAVETLLAEVSPAAVIHLAAVIPPLCYAKPSLAYKVNVGATANLVKAAEAHAKPPRLVQASSIAVYGPRNPYRITDVLTAQTPVNPYDNYGKHKVEAETIVRASHLNWVILRLGGVLTTEPNLGMDPNLIFFEGVLPTDGRLQTVDVRDVAFAFAAATTADVLGQTLLIGGDDSHRLRQGDIGQSTSAAMGLVGALPPGRKGDPNNDGGWFATDWMDSATAQTVLKHQHYSWPDMLTETADKVGWKRYLFRVIAPVAREYLKRQSSYYGKPAGYGNPWEAVRNKWGAPENDGKVS